MLPRIDAEWWARALSFAFVLALLIAPWPHLPGLVRDAVEAFANPLLAERSWHPVAILWLRGGEELSALSREHGAAWVETWFTTLWIESTSTALRTYLPIDLRALWYLPTATSIALGCSLRLARGWRGVWLAVAALATTQLVTWLIAITPIASFLGGASPVRVFAFDTPTQIALNIVYRALLSPPGMAYAVPAMTWLSFWWFESRVGAEPAHRFSVTESQ